ncbi:MAG: Hsp20 family protein [Variibacter sp.]
MRTFDFSPFARSAIGFETLFDRLNDRSQDSNEGYPPYDIVRKGEDEFQINIAVAGFSCDEISITAEASQLTVAGKKQDKGDVEYLYQGISARSFERRFNLADYIEVESADFQNGLLHINLVRRIPEKLKPRTIAIGNVTKLETKGSGKAA